MTTADDILRPRPVLDLRGFMMRSILAGAGALVLAILIAVIRRNLHEFMHAYLVAYMFWFGLAMGCLALAMLYNVVGGRWGDVARPVLRAATMSVPLMAILFIPILCDLPANYAWARDSWITPGASMFDRVIADQHHKWLNPSAVVTRYVIYFVIWIALALIVNAALRRRTVESGPPGNIFSKLCAPGIPIYGITVTFAAIDWVMTLEPRWYSTVFGLLIIAAQGLTAFAFCVLATYLISERVGRVRKTTDEFGKVSATMDGAGEPASGPLVKPTDFSDLGNLMLTFTMLWAYLGLSQYLIIWAGNLPSETQYFVPRVMSGWRWVALLLLALHFFLPFLMLLSRNVKRSGPTLARLAAFLLVMRFVDWMWWVEPSVQYHQHGAGEAGHVAALGMWLVQDLLLAAGVGGIWLAFFGWQLHGRDVLPPPVADAHDHGPRHPHEIAPHHGGITPDFATARLQGGHHV